MSLTRKDAASTVLAALVVLVYAANSQGWGVPLLTSNRWAAGTIGLLGMLMCAQGQAAERWSSPAVVVLSALGVAALVLVVVALWTGTQGALALLALVTIALWAGATARHAAGHAGHRPLHTS